MNSTNGNGLSDLAAQTGSPTNLRGVVINALNGFPLQGLEVAASLQEAPDSSPDSTSALGPGPVFARGHTDARGAFALALEDSTWAQRTACLVDACPEESIRLDVYDDQQRWLGASELKSAAGMLRADAPGEVDTLIAVQLPEVELSPQVWHELADCLAEARLVQLSDVVRQLVVEPAERSLLGDWPLEKRHAVELALERTFLDPQGRFDAQPIPLTFYRLSDPDALQALAAAAGEENGHAEGAQRDLALMDGKLQSFHGLQNVDWIVDLEGLGQGRLDTALFKHRIVDHVSEIDRGPLLDLYKRSTAPEVGYRDYLRAITTGPQGSEGFASLHQKLSDRFHQDFRTYNTKSEEANLISIRILKSILSAPGGATYGFAIPAANLPAQKPDQTNRAYLDALIGLTGYHADELNLRYRTRFDRPDGEKSSEVLENIYTLQRFYTDSYQSDPEPFPLIDPNRLGQAPFFLEYDEWLRVNGPFYPENHYLISSFLQDRMLTPERAQKIKSSIVPTSNAPIVTGKGIDELNAFLDYYVAVYHLFRAFRLLESLEYDLALEQTNIAYNLLLNAFKKYPQTPSKALLLKRKQIKIENIQQLESYTKENLYGPMPLPEGMYSYANDKVIGDFQEMFWSQGWYIAHEENYEKIGIAIFHLGAYVVPLLRSEIALAKGDFETALNELTNVTLFRVGHANLSDPAGWQSGYPGAPMYLYSAGNLPYTNWLPYPDTSLKQPSLGGSDIFTVLARDLALKYTHSMEMKFFRLRQGNAILEWADALFRTDEPGNLARARELYKAALWLHGTFPPILPNWQNLPDVGEIPAAFLNKTENPALASQKSRARLGLYKIENGLNYYGYPRDYVPVLRYRPAYDAANRFAMLGKSAERDFLFGVQQMETAMLDTMKAYNLLKKADQQVKIAVDQIANAQYNVEQAQKQVDQVKAAIEAKKKEIEDSNSLIGQFKDYFAGAGDALKGLALVYAGEAGISIPGLGGAAGAGGAAGGASGSVASGAQSTLEGMGLGASAGILVGFGTFYYASYTALEGMADTYKRQQGELATLRDQGLVEATKAVHVREREVEIAQAMRAIAQADVDLARDMLGFQSGRVLNEEFWAGVARVMRRVMRRYIELGAGLAWIAERALAFEQNREINVIRYDYYVPQLQGVTGADLLLLDLAELEAGRLNSLKQTVPIRHTFSLATDFPFQFAQLLQTGRCQFRTDELPFQNAYPGTHSYRVRSASVQVQNTRYTTPLRGLLINQGISVVRGAGQADGNARTWVRPAEALPISEFRLARDMEVFGLPDEGLLPFEGSGVNTFWQLDFPAAANPYGMESVMDVLITLDVRAQFSPPLYAAYTAQPVQKVRRFLLVSATRYLPASMEDLRTKPSADFAFDLAKVPLSPREKNHVLKNLAFFLAGDPASAAGLPGVQASFSADTQPAAIPLTFEKGVVMSNIPVPGMPAPLAPSPLNVLADAQAVQRYELRIEKAQNPGIDFQKVVDVVLAVEYEAEI